MSLIVNGTRYVPESQQLHTPSVDCQCDRCHLARLAASVAGLQKNHTDILLVMANQASAKITALEAKVAKLEAHNVSQGVS